MVLDKIFKDFNMSKKGYRFRDKVSILSILLLTSMPWIILRRHPRIFRFRERLRAKVLMRSIIKFRGCLFIPIASESLMILSDFFEPMHFYYIRKALNRKSSCTFVDVGAHIGRYTIIVGKYYAAKVVALEPESLNYTILMNNVRLNQLKNVFCYKAAAWNRNGEVFLHLSHSEGEHSVVTNFSIKSERVRAVKLDSIAAFDVALIKIDVEGAELEVLDGARKTIEQNKPALIIEVRRENWEKMKEFLKGFGYNCEIIHGSEIPEAFDIFCEVTERLS
ncbi:MAG: FkbM family methyltransferase [Desulfurococcaceae archaeon]